MLLPYFTVTFSKILNYTWVSLVFVIKESFNKLSNDHFYQGVIPICVVNKQVVNQDFLKFNNFINFRFLS